MSGDLRPCGTTAAYQRHRRRGETPCAACKSAWATDHADYLKNRASGAVLAKKRAYDAAYERALGRLIAAHKSEMKALVRDEVERGVSS